MDVGCWDLKHLFLWLMAFYYCRCIVVVGGFAPAHVRPQWDYNLDQTGKEFISYLKLPRFFLTAQVPLFSDEI